MRETKIQNNITKNLLTAIPNEFNTALDKSLTTILTPYLENLVFGLNKLQEQAVLNSKKETDIVDDLF